MKPLALELVLVFFAFELQAKDFFFTPQAISRMVKSQINSAAPVSPVSLSSFQEHMATVNTWRDYGYASTANWMALAGLSFCPSCFKSDLVNLSELSDFEKALYNFVARNFEKSSVLFDDVIANFPREVTNVELNQALQFQSLYFIRVKRDPHYALRVLERYKGNKALPLETTKNIEAWIGLFHDWEENPNLGNDNINDVRRIMNSALQTTLWDRFASGTNPRFVSYVRTAAAVEEFIQRNDRSDESPEALFRTSLLLKHAKSEFLYAVGQLYLRECVSRDLKRPFTRECYDEYEVGVRQYLKGRHLPREMIDDLAKLKAKL